jgi:hypothetical protein
MKKVFAIIMLAGLVSCTTTEPFSIDNLTVSPNGGQQVKFLTLSFDVNGLFAGSLMLDIEAYQKDTEGYRHKVDSESMAVDKSRTYYYTIDASTTSFVGDYWFEIYDGNCQLAKSEEVRCSQ